MPHDGNQTDEHSDASVSRRRYVQAAVAAGAAGLAGCNQGGSDDQSGSTNETGNTSGSSGTQQEPVSDTITTTVNNNPEASNLNRWAASPNAAGNTWLRELVDPRNIARARETFFSGEEFDAPWMEDTDSISIPTMLTNYEVEPPYDVYETHDDRLTYWDGTPLDAQARRYNDLMPFYINGGKFTESMTQNNEVVSQWEYHWWRNKGEAEGQEPNPTNAQILNAQLPAQTPFHPKFTEPYIQSFQDASNEDAVNSVTSELEGDNVTFFRMAEEGLGSGLYKIASPDDVSAERMILTKRDDHPNEHATIPKVELRFATTERLDVLLTEGKIDIDTGMIQGEAGRNERASYPDYIQEVDRFLDTGTDMILFNWNNEHLQNLWVRRAIVAATDWEAVGANGWGAPQSVPMQYHTGLSNTLAQEVFSEEFLDSLYQYPMGKDDELAAEWMRKAGYTKEGGVWTSPEGEAANLDFISNAGIDWTGGTTTMQTNLQNFGLQVGYTELEGATYNQALADENLNYDMAIEWGPGATNLWDVYWSEGDWWRENLVAGDANDPIIGPVDPETTGPETTHDTVDIQGKPLEVQIPSDPQNLDAAPERAGANPQLSGDAVNIDLADLVHSFRKPDITDEEFQRNARLCARYYNFHLPDFKFHQYTTGIFGNVRDFDFPPRGHELNRFYHEFGGDDFQVLAGIPQVKYDQEYEKP